MAAALLEREALDKQEVEMIMRGEELTPVPMSPVALVRTPLLTAGGKLRLLAEPLMRRRDGREETVAEFAGRRLGREAVDNLVGPFLTGVYAGDEKQLGAAAVFGSLVENEQRVVGLGPLPQSGHELRFRRVQADPVRQQVEQHASELALALVENRQRSFAVVERDDHHLVEHGDRRGGDPGACPTGWAVVTQLR